MEHRSILEMVKTRLSIIASMAIEHKAPEPLKKAIDDLRRSVSNALLRIATKISGRINTHADIQEIMTKCSIKSAFGDSVNPFELKTEDFKPELFALSLSREKRFWNQTKLSVAEHCVNAVKVAQKLFPQRDDLAKWALFHEIFEAYTGDLATPFKKCLPEYKVAENKALKHFAENIGLVGEMPVEVHLIDKTMMITEAINYMKDEQYWRDLGVSMGEKDFGFPLYPYEKDVIELRKKPLVEDLALKEFAQMWISLKLPITEDLINMAYPKAQAYLAGPGVFKPNASDLLHKEKEIFENTSSVRAVIPFDADFEFTGDKHNDASMIRKFNIEMIQESLYIVADLNNFRGYEPDSGTAYEVGYASALGKTVVLYSKDCDASLREQHGNALCDNNGNTYEDFDLPKNLMFFSQENNTHIVSTLEEAAKLVSTLEAQRLKDLVKSAPYAITSNIPQYPVLCDIALKEDPSLVKYIKDDFMRVFYENEIKHNGGVISAALEDELYCEEENLHITMKLK